MHIKPNSLPHVALFFVGMKLLARYSLTVFRVHIQLQHMHKHFSFPRWGWADFITHFHLPLIQRHWINCYLFCLLQYIACCLWKIRFYSENVEENGSNQKQIIQIDHFINRIGFFFKRNVKDEKRPIRAKTQIKGNFVSKKPWFLYFWNNSQETQIYLVNAVVLLFQCNYTIEFWAEINVI